jgi:hypothetical protein
MAMELGADNSSEFVGIVIYAFPEWRKFSYMAEVLYGLEEEEVPFLIRKDTIQSKDMLSAAYRAADRSAFGVGICCTKNGMVIHHRNLKKQKPLFYISRDQFTRKKARLLGTNAARLIKGLPFEEI